MNNLASNNNGPQEGLAWKPNLSGNSVSWNGSAVVKLYGSKPDNYYREYAVLKKLKNIPVPHVLDSSTTGQLHMDYIDGIGGKEAIEAGHAANLLKEMGKLLRQLHAIPVKTFDGILKGEGNVIVHGDFAYYNCIMSKDGKNILAIIDWEEAYTGDAVTDLAWCEWQFRNKYPRHNWAVPNLFNAYGSTPDWDLRQEAVRIRLNELQHRVSTITAEKEIIMQQNNYFVIKFNDRMELAAFIAALSRFLNYPRGTIFMERTNAAEVWIKNNSCELVLNESAKEAVLKEFGSFHCDLLQTDSLSPSEYKPVIGGHEVPSMGLNDAESFLKEIG